MLATLLKQSKLLLQAAAEVTVEVVVKLRL
jgi:hypothetical protein